MTIDEMVTLIQAVSDNGLTSFEYDEGDRKLVLKKVKKEQVVAVAQAGGVAAGGAGIPVTVLSGAGSAAGPVQTGSPEGMIPSGGVAAEAAGTLPDIGSDKVVTSPLVGTFYSAASPDGEPFVKPGDHVKKGQVLGIIEAMKLMNEIESEYDGVVEAVLIENEGVVEYGQPLFRIR